MDWVVALVLAPIAHFSGKPLAVGIALGLVGSAAAIYLALCLGRERRFLATFATLTREIAETRKAAGTQEEQLARADEAFRSSKLAAAWDQYRASVSFENGSVYAHSDPSAFIVAERLRGHGYVKWYSTLGGVFLTLGLFFTFVGLSAALLKVGGDDGRASMTPDQLKVAVQGILAVSSVKFITSLAGILAYIFWSIVARQSASAQDKAVEGLVAEVRRLSTYVAPEAVLRDVLRASVEQREQFKTFGNDLAVAIGHQIQVAMKAQFGTLPDDLARSVGGAVASSIAPVREELSAIASQIGRTGGDLAQGAGDVFNRVWNEGIGSHMSMFGEQMGRTIAALERLPEKVREAEGGLGGEIGRAAEQLSEMSLRMNASVERQQQSVASAVEALTQRIAGIPAAVEGSSRDAADAVARSVRETAESAAAAAAEASRRGSERIAGDMGAVAATLAASAETLRSAGDHSAAGLKAARAELASGVADGVRIVSETAKAAGDKLSETVASLSAVVDGLSRRLGETTETMAAQHAQLARAGEVVAGATTSLVRAAGSVEQATAPLPGALGSINVALDRVGQASEQIRIATVAGERVAASMTATADSAGRALGTQADRMDELRGSVGETLAELVQGVTSLGAAISQCIATYDREIANSIGSLEAAMLDVADIVDERRSVGPRAVA